MSNNISVRLGLRLSGGRHGLGVSGRAMVVCPPLEIDGRAIFALIGVDVGVSIASSCSVLPIVVLLLFLSFYHYIMADCLPFFI